MILDPFCAGTFPRLILGPKGISEHSLEGFFYRVILRLYGIFERLAAPGLSAPSPLYVAAPGGYLGMSGPRPGFGLFRLYRFRFAFSGWPIFADFPLSSRPLLRTNSFLDPARGGRLPVRPQRSYVVTSSAPYARSCIWHTATPGRASQLQRMAASPRARVARCLVYIGAKSYVDCYTVALGRALPRASRRKEAAGIGIARQRLA